MSDLDDLDEIYENTKSTTGRKDARGRKEGKSPQTTKGSKQPFAAAQRTKPKPVTLATEPFLTNHLNKDRRHPK